MLSLIALPIWRRHLPSALPGYEDDMSTSNVSDDEESEEDYNLLDQASTFKEHLLMEHHACFAHTYNLVVKDEKQVGLEMSSRSVLS